MYIAKGSNENPGSFASHPHRAEVSLLPFMGGEGREEGK